MFLFASNWQKKIKMLEQDSWLPVNLNQNRIIQSQPQLLATQLLYGREEWLPPNGYSHQWMNNDLSVSYEAMGWPTHAFSTLCLFWPLTAPVAFQRTNVCFIGRLPIIQPSNIFIKIQRTILRCNTVSFCKYTNFFTKTKIVNYL